MRPSIKIDDKKMRKALSSYAKISSKTVPEILNKKTPFVIRRAMRLTPKTAVAKIRSELGSLSNPSLLAIKIVRSRLKKQNKKATQAEVSKATRSMIRARMASVRYISLGWLPALGQWQTITRPLNSRSRAAKEGRGRRATEFRKSTYFKNAAPGAVSEGKEALKNAMRIEARDTERFAARKMQSNANKFNRRK